jgi:phosphatidylglycerol lysyltransferase
VAFTALSYLVLTRYDASALQYVGARVAERTVLLTSFVAYALSNSVGLGPLSGGVVRMRMYAAAGVEPAAIARAIVFNAVAFGLGLAPFGAVGLLWGAPEVAAALHTPAWLLRLLALALLAAVGGFLVVCARPAAQDAPVPAWRTQIPPLGLALRQLAISAVELLASALVLWVLLPPGPRRWSSGCCSRRDSWRLPPSSRSTRSRSPRGSSRTSRAAWVSSRP